ncbi:ribonuclease III [Pseudoclavibacter endophyticus]|uniref:Ribonuclease 3 n=1 Tax=Pseudoclavibacter endophyticus TaxID=1778590 RepID=A0A6H9WNP7_9MICO|nr:ribonuclease III [Pseudoclavibacter endophyticus]KAB1650486.1 ribonuclease III [Pseudoclavibacter endophyticus]
MDPDAAPSAQLAQALGVDVVPDLLELALTHRSYAFEQGGLPHNERLEWLGDAILGEAVTVMLYLAHPELNEGQLGRRRIALVSTVSLAEIARGIGLGAYIHLGRGEQLTGGRDKDSILADTMEAVIGAAYLSCGHEVASDLVRRLVEPLRGQTERFGVAMDPKTALQELVDTLGGEAPAYRVEGEGPQHDRVYRAQVTVASASGTGRAAAPLIRAEGEGRSKRQAEMAAALAAWNELSSARDAPGDAAAQGADAEAEAEADADADADADA